MYVISNEVRNEIAGIVLEAEAELKNQVKFDEYIAVPYYGSNIILRFNYTGSEALTIEKLNALENNLRKIAGPKYMANFMGNIYRELGLDMTRLPEILEKIDKSFDAPIEQNKYHERGLSGDVDFLKEILNLPVPPIVWEIQVNKNDLVFILLGEAEKETVSMEYNGNRLIVSFIPFHNSYRGLMKAAWLAQRDEKSICQVLLDYTLTYERMKKEEYDYE